MASPKINYYEVLGLNQSATSNEIRRAYRILARRYHPDLNPGKSSEERFKKISLAYQTLSDSDKRKAHDADIEADKRIKAGFAAYQRAQNFQRSSAQNSQNRSYKSENQRPKTARRTNFGFDQIKLANFKELIKQAKSFLPTSKKPKELNENIKNVSTSKVSVVEVSINMKDALFGGRKSIEIPADEKTKKISVKIPAGVRTGSVLRLRTGSTFNEDYVIILRLAPHPLIEILPKGILIQIPITLKEAFFGASIKVPGLEEEELLKISPGSQSGQELRLESRGIKFDDGKRGDIFYRLNIQIPNSIEAVGIKEKVEAVSEYYEANIRQNLPKNLKS